MKVKRLGTLWMKQPAVVRLAAVLVLLVVWEIYGRSANPILFTYPTAVARAFVELVSTGELQTYLRQSVEVFAYGMLAAVLVGVVLGVMIGRFALVEYATDMILGALYSTPMVAVVPLIVLWFGFKLTAKTIVVFLFAVFPVLINTAQGVKSVEPSLLEVARAFRSSERQLWRDVIIPSAIPFLIAGLRLAVGRALVGMVIAEFYTSIAGLGYMIVRYANSFETDKLFVPLVLLMIAGGLMMEFLKHLEGWIAPWRKQREEG